MAEEEHHEHEHKPRWELIEKLHDKIDDNIDNNNNNWGLKSALSYMLKSYSNHVMRKNFLSINIPKLPVCTTEQGVEIIKTSIKKLSDWRDILELIPSKFKKTNTLKKSGIAGLFTASLELTREGVINIMQKKTFDKLLIREKK